MTESFEDAIKALRHVAYGNGNVLRIADRIVAAHERETKVEGICGPITGELRERISQAERIVALGCDTQDTQVRMNRAWLTEKLDAIDSIHANLELENERLKEENEVLKRSAAHAYVSGYEQGKQDGREGLIELPKDADKVPIRIGDVMVYADGNTCPLPVVALVPPAVFLTDDGPRYAEMCRHAPDTWERIEEDARKAMSLYSMPNVVMTLVARCKALAGDAE